MKVIINITSFMDIGSGGAEHYYAKSTEIEHVGNVYKMMRDDIYERYGKDSDRLTRSIDTQKEIDYLNKKDSWSGWKLGDETERFNSIEQIKKMAGEKWDCDIVFLRNNDLQSDFHILCREHGELIPTNKKLKIGHFTGYSSEFKDLIRDSIHEIIETPDRYEGQKSQDGYWVMGITEPELVLKHECEILTKL